MKVVESPKAKRVKRVMHNVFIVSSLVQVLLMNDRYAKPKHLMYTLIISRNNNNIDSHPCSSSSSHTSQIEPSPPLTVESSEGKAHKYGTCAQESSGNDGRVYFYHRRQKRTQSKSCGEDATKCHTRGHIQGYT